MSTVVNGLDLVYPSEGRTLHARAEPVADKEAIRPEQLESWLGEIQLQPAWRREADKCSDYYDSNQIDSETMAKLEERGMGPLITNLVAPTVNAVLGMEAKTRTDWRVGADDDQFQDVAEALSSKIHEVERESQADRAVSEGYAQQIKSGFGCVEVSRQSNPFEFPYRVQSIHRREIFWDWRSTQPDWSDARYVVRKRWFDPDQLGAFFPKHVELIRFAATGWRDWSDHLMSESTDINLFHAHDQESRMSWDDYEWRDTERGRVVCFEVWYRTWHRGLVMALPGGRVVEFDRKNPMHMAVVASGMVQPKVAVYDKLRVAFYIGPHRVQDLATNRRKFPYIPFFGYREDLTGVPYGLIRAMISPQDEVNARAQRMMWLLSARRTFIENDALDETKNTHSDVSREISRANAYIITDSKSKRGSQGIRVDDNMQLSQQQFQIMQERKAAIQEVAGVYNAMMGQQSNATSGLAIQSLVEQGTTTLAEINDNYRMARRGVGDALLMLIREDMTEQSEVVIDNGSTKRRVMVNIPMVDESTGQKYKQNDIQNAQVKVALEDVPSTPTYRAQQFAQLAEVTKSLPSEMQAFVVPFIIESSDLPNRRKLADLLRKQMGIADDPNDPESEEKADQAEQAQQELAAQAAQLEQAKAESEIAERSARAGKLQAETQVLLQPEPPHQPQDGSAELDKARIEQETELKKTQMQQDGETERARMKIKADKVDQLVADVAQLAEEINQA